MRPLGLVLLAAVLLPGCAIVKAPEVRELSGPTDGYTPTAAFLKLNVKQPDGSVQLLDFDRRDWYASRIAELVDQKQVRSVTAQALPRDVLNEYVAQSVADPSSLAGLRYDEMDASPEARAQMDDEYQALLERYLSRVPPISPAGLLPADPLP